MPALGVDGTSDGWFGVVFDEGPEVSTIGPCKGITELLHDVPTDWTVLIDIPIGLPDKNQPRRNCDIEARRKLSPVRHSSVFDPPIREVIEFDSYQKANETQKEKIDRGLSAQAWGLHKKIIDVDQYLVSTSSDNRPAVRESHPEVCYAAISDDRPTMFSKTGQPAAAVFERFDRLSRILEDPVSNVADLSSGLDSTVHLHDVLDALVLALTASEETGNLESIPNDPQWDSEDLSMEIVFASTNG